MKKQFLLLCLLVLGLVACKEDPIEYTLSMRPTELSLLKGEEEQIKPLLTPYLEGVTYTYKSKDTDVASVSSIGLVTAVGKGETRVYATTVIDGKEYSAFCVVTVKAIGLSLSKKEAALFVGDELTLEAVMSDKSTPDITWQSSNTSVAVVDNGKVGAVGAGTATITASCTSKGVDYEAECEIMVVTSLQVSPEEMSLMPGQTEQIEVNATGVTFTSSNTSVAMVSSQGLVSAVANGTAVITVQCGSHSASVNVTVQGFAISPNPASVGIGATTQLTTNAPEDAEVTWTSNNTALATVDANGLVSGISAGSATITASWNGKTASCSLTVREALTISQHTAELVSDQTITLTTNYPSSDVKWTSSYPIECENGVIAPTNWIYENQINTLTVYAEYEGMIDSCAVTVYPKPYFWQANSEGIYITYVGEHNLSIRPTCYNATDFVISISDVQFANIVFQPDSENPLTGFWYFTVLKKGSAIVTATYKGSVACLKGRKLTLDVRANY